jgi:hypothetical protein
VRFPTTAVFSGPRRALLKTVLFQRLQENDEAEQEYQISTSALGLDNDSRTVITYHLYPEYKVGLI